MCCVLSCLIHICLGGNYSSGMEMYSSALQCRCRVKDECQPIHNRTNLNTCVPLISILQQQAAPLSVSINLLVCAVLTQQSAHCQHLFTMSDCPFNFNQAAHSDSYVKLRFYRYSGDSVWLMFFFYYNSYIKILNLRKIY